MPARSQRRLNQGTRRTRIPCAIERDSDAKDGGSRGSAGRTVCTVGHRNQFGTRLSRRDFEPADECRGWNRQVKCVGRDSRRRNDGIRAGVSERRDLRCARRCGTGAMVVVSGVVSCPWLFGGTVQPAGERRRGQTCHDQKGTSRKGPQEPPHRAQYTSPELARRRLLPSDHARFSHFRTRSEPVTLRPAPRACAGLTGGGGIFTLQKSFGVDFLADRRWPRIHGGHLLELFGRQLRQMTNEVDEGASSIPHPRASRC